MERVRRTYDTNGYKMKECSDNGFYSLLSGTQLFVLVVYELVCVVNRLAWRRPEGQNPTHKRLLLMKTAGHKQASLAGY